MLAAVAFIPSAPVMVPQLAGAAAAQTVGLRDAIFAAARRLPPRWVAVGVGESALEVGPRHLGTFAGYGVDVAVALSPTADVPAALPLAALITGWVRGEAHPRACARVQVLPAALPTDAAAAAGEALRREIAAAAAPTGVLVIADGHRTLTPAAPGGHDRASVTAQRHLDGALAAGDTAALRSLPAAVTGRVAYQVLAGLAGPATPTATGLYTGAPFGVGYSVGLWQW